MTPVHPALFDRALALFDAANAHDPNVIETDGHPQPRELFFSLRLSEWVRRLDPNASEPLLLAARCQHIRRWEIPRDSYPMTRAGYLKWRADLKKFHARIAGEILTSAGYAPEVIARVQDLNLKKNFPSDPDCQTLEDALCMVFLKFQFSDLLRKTDPEKMINAVQKTWNKMSPAARQLALELPYSPEERHLLDKALTPTGT